MKTIVFFCISLISSYVLAQKDTSKIKLIDPSDSTGFGIPDGNLVSTEIGVAGGSVVSEDGRIELIFPEGALIENTTISIQPVTNLAPNGSGKSYKFEPSGIQFKKPVEIIVHYTDEEADECHPEFMALAMQDHMGKWSFSEYVDWDSTGKKLKGFIEHFSGFSNIRKLALRIDANESRVKARRLIEIVDISQRWGSETQPASFADQNKFAKIVIKNPILWYVNQFENGNRIVGTIDPNEVPYARTNSKHFFAIFTAPESLPRKNPVTIRADVYVFSGVKKGFQYKRSLSCRVEIFDEYDITIAGELDNTNLGIGTRRLVDTSSLVVQFRNSGSNARDIKNSLLVQERENCPNRCVCVYVNKQTCTGFIHIAGMNSVALEGTPESYHTAKLFFKPAQAISPVFKITCPGNATMPTMPVVPVSALPDKLTFKLSDEVQEIVFDESHGVIGKVKVTIKRIKENNQ